MAIMAAKRRDNDQIDWRSDWWLWPAALLLVMGGWGQALWMGENVPPEGLAPLWLLLWAGSGVAGATLPIYWLGRRWWPVAWAAVAAWVGVPSVHDLARYYNRAAQTGDEGLYSISALLLLLLLLGVGLSGVMMTISWFASQRWPGPTPNIRPLRQGFWAGLFAMICGWLLINRAFTLVPAVLLAGALVLIETFFVTRESPREHKA
jgi:hypothetical protein